MNAKEKIIPAPVDIEPQAKLTSLEKNGLLYVPRLFMQMWGMWPLNLFENKTHRIWYAIYRFFLLGYYFTFFVLLLIECIILTLNNKPFERITQSAALVFIILVLTFKSIIYQKNEIPKMCLAFMEVEKDIWRSNDKEVQDSYKKILGYNKYLNICVIVSSIYTVVSFSLLSFFELFHVGANQWNFEEKSFMYELYFPFNKTSHFVAILIGNVYAGFLGIILNIACQSMFYSLIIFAVSRLIVLQIRIRKFDKFAEDLKMDIELTIKGFIQEHQNTIRFVEQLNESTKYVMLLEFFLNSINMATFSFQIIASIALADAIYESPWYKQNKSAKQMLHIMILRAQKPLTLTIGPFNPMTIETAIGTMKAAYSYVTLMTNSYKK